MPEQLRAFLNSLETFWLNLSLFLPQIIASFVLLIVGWLAAKLLRKLALRVLKFLRIDVAAEKSGIDNFLVKGGVRYTTTIVANLIYWFVLFTVMLPLLNSLGLQTAAGCRKRWTRSCTKMRRGYSSCPSAERRSDAMPWSVKR